MNEVEKIINNLNGIKHYVYDLKVLTDEEKHNIMVGIQSQIKAISDLDIQLIKKHDHNT